MPLICIFCDNVARHGYLTESKNDKWFCNEHAPHKPEENGKPEICFVNDIHDEPAILFKNLPKAFDKTHVEKMRHELVTLTSRTL